MENKHKYPAGFEKEYASWDEETKKMIACTGWIIVRRTATAVIKTLREGNKHGSQE